MSKIYNCFIIRHLTEAFYSLSADEQNELLGKAQQALADVGGETIVMCDVRWATDGAQIFGVEVYPNIEAVQEHQRLLNELNWGRYVQAESYLGTEWQGTS